MVGNDVRSDTNGLGFNALPDPCSIALLRPESGWDRSHSADRLNLSDQLFRNQQLLRGAASAHEKSGPQDQGSGLSVRMVRQWRGLREILNRCGSATWIAKHRAVVFVALFLSGH